MICCDNLIHPFQNDPGVSQRQRVVEDLLSGSAKIDGRTMAELLDYFTQLSRHINYYDTNLKVSNWQPFFRESIPFSLASVVRYNKESTQEKFDKYNLLFRKRPSRQSLQLIIHFMYHQVISRIDQWHKQVKGSELPVERVIETLIRDKLAEPVRKFISLTNVAVQRYRIRRIDFGKLVENGVWNFTGKDLTSTAFFNAMVPTKRKRLIALQQEVTSLFPGFLNIISITAEAAELSIEKSLFPLKEELQKRHTPHLALLFAFLKLFQYLQGDLNSYTRKHLDFFYKDVLKLKPKDATPDKAHILFEIQKALDKYRLKKDLQVKDGKDSKKAETYFSLEDEIIVNKTTVADVRTLFLNNKVIYNTAYLEGGYIAPDARKADGVKIDFKDDAPKNWPTVGAKFSKYTDPEQKRITPYLPARLGFILASPVLLMNEGTRTVTIQLACILDKEVCDGIGAVDTTVDSCCSPETITTLKDGPCKPVNVLPIDPEAIIDNVNKALKRTYCFISQQQIGEAEKKGIDKEIVKKIKRRFLTNKCYKPLCCENEKKYIRETFVRHAVWLKFLNRSVPNPVDQKILNEIFPSRRVFKIYFSGAKEWVTPEPSDILGISLAKQATNDRFVLSVKVKLKADKPAISSYDKEKLKEDFGTKSPLVKIELDSTVGLILNKKLRKQLKLVKDDDTCCLFNTIGNCADKISLYHFFKYARVVKKLGNNVNDDTDETKIEVKVCGLKKFVVQNDESVQDVNGPIYAFGARPKVIDFDVSKPFAAAGSNLTGPNFYIGSKEVFCKKWDEVYINLNWKDKPTNFHEYYKAYWVNPVDMTDFGLKETKFEMNLSLLEDGNWKTEFPYTVPNPPASNTVVQNAITKSFNRKLFQDDSEAPFFDQLNLFEQTIYIAKEYIEGISPKFRITDENLVKYAADVPSGFLRINLQNQDFLHKDYAFVLARQMMAFGKLPNDHVESAVYYDSTIPGGGPIVISTTNMLAALNNSGPIASLVNADVQRVDTKAGNSTHDITLNESKDIRAILKNPDTPNSGDLSLNDAAKSLDLTINNNVIAVLNSLKKFAAIIPNEPWTPIIKNISLDYIATATIEDIDLIQLHPYQSTCKHEEIEAQPTLFPTFCDEGTLFIGLKEFVPGSNLNLLFQLAEATADSESEREELHWYYLSNDQWKSLRKGFEVINDATDGLTTSGIIKFALPENMTNENTVLPKGLHWIKASIARNSRSVSETIGIHTQAIQVVFTNEAGNDKLRLDKPLLAESISKLREADANIKTVAQPYDSFGGREPEAEKHYYVRVSELLRHKSRAVQKWDYERLTLEAFPQIYKAKCINHSFALNASEYKNDFPLAPGYVLLAVIPDLTKLKAGNSFEPKVPVSLLQSIMQHVRKRTSPFVRLQVMNPRYEKIRFCLKVKLLKGKDENYYNEKLEQDLREFLAPWAVGEYSKLTFGQCVNRSDLVRFLEGLDYIDFIIELKMQHDADAKKTITDHLQEVCPRTPRSILIAGDIDICINQNNCEKWDENIKCLHLPDRIIS